MRTTELLSPLRFTDEETEPHTGKTFAQGCAESRQESRLSPKVGSFYLRGHVYRQRFLLCINLTLEKAVYCQPAYLTSMQSISCEITGLGESLAGIQTARRNINNLRYADGTTLMAESEEELKSLYEGKGRE